MTPLLLRALVDTLKQHPVFNCSLDEATQDIVYKEYFHIGIAVDTEQGLLVPVVRDADKKSLLDLAQELETLAQRARERKSGREEMQGGTFTISNQGAIGGAHFTPSSTNRGGHSRHWPRRLAARRATGRSDRTASARPARLEL